MSQLLKSQQLLLNQNLSSNNQLSLKLLKKLKLLKHLSCQKSQSKKNQLPNRKKKRWQPLKKNLHPKEKEEEEEVIEFVAKEEVEEKDLIEAITEVGVNTEVEAAEDEAIMSRDHMEKMPKDSLLSRMIMNQTEAGVATEEEDNEDGEETVVEKEVLGEVTEEITEVGVNTEAEAEVKDHKERDKNSPKESKSTRKLKQLQLPKFKHKSDNIDLTNSLIN